jgi:crotonobetainyl-CoA:carnitine CoA-transferase CaiB-like acyl-CoA transferase
VTLIEGVRVIDLSTGIAGPYASKLLADAGADVVKVEGPSGDPLRRWTASGFDLGGCDSALFRYLNTSKRSVVGGLGTPEVVALLDGADAVIEDGEFTDDELADLRATRPHLVVVSVTPFGRSGPFAARPATEFTLQAWCGSTASRGTPDREPLHAAGRLGEWISGTYTAVGALAALLGGEGDHVDVSMLECMSVTLGGFGPLYASLAGFLEAAASFPGPFRSLEVPSIVPTADGLVGFCTVTGQQFEDFLLLIERPELRGEPRFATAQERMANQAEFNDMVLAWTTRHTTAEVIELASALRIPVAPVGTPEAIPTFDHFVERGVFVRCPGGGFVQPRVPYRVAGVEPRPFTAAPYLGEHTGDAVWNSRSAERPVVRRQAGRPLDGLRIVDLTAFWAGPSATQMLAALGAEVIKVEGLTRPDGMRFNATRKPTEDRWWEWSPVFQWVNTNKRAVTLDMGTEDGRALVLDLIETADGIVENFSPRVLDGFGITWEAVSRRNPRAIMVRMPSFGLDGPWRDRTGFAQTMEQISGMAWISGFPDDQPVIPRGPCDPLAGMHAVVAFLAALDARDRTGAGCFVEVSMIEAALNCAAEVAIEHSAYGASLHRAGNRGPVAAPQGVYPCAGTERWLALAVTTDEQWVGLRKVLGDPAWAAGEELATDAGRRAAHDDIDERLRATVADRDLDELVEELAAAGVPAAPVVSPLRMLDHPQHAARGFVERIEHPVVGTHDLPGMPFRLASRPGRWFERGSPTLGQDNREVLSGVLGLTGDEVDRLADAGVIGDRIAR